VPTNERWGVNNTPIPKYVNREKSIPYTQRRVLIRTLQRTSNFLQANTDIKNIKSFSRRVKIFFTRQREYATIYVLLTAHLSIILAINQLNAQNLLL